MQVRSFELHYIKHFNGACGARPRAIAAARTLQPTHVSAIIGLHTGRRCRVTNMESDTVCGIA